MADHLFDEGFYPRAAALDKKPLRVQVLRSVQTRLVDAYLATERGEEDLTSARATVGAPASEAGGDPVSALAILIGLEFDAGGSGDVRVRIERLARAQPRGATP